jgi:PAS domain S-box-containing protein
MTRPPTQAAGGTHPADRPGGGPEGGTAPEVAGQQAPETDEHASSPDFYRALIERVPVYIAVVGTDGRRWLSPATKRLIGSRPDASLAEVVAEVVHPADRDRFFAILTKPTGTEPADPTGHSDVRLRDQYGRWHALSFLTADLRGHPGIDGVVVYGFDVTQSRAAEQRQRQTLEEHNKRLAELSALKSEFISIVSHELRTPLTAIASFTDARRAGRAHVAGRAGGGRGDRS